MTYKSNTAQQLPLDFQLSSYDEASAFLDDSRNGHYAIVTKRKDTRVSQRMMPLHTLPYVLEQHTKNFEQYNQTNGKADTWISQATFNGWQNDNGQTIAFRRKTTLASIATLFCDLDYYKDEKLKDLSADKMADMVLLHCNKNEIPLPSIIIDTGRGLQIKWYHEQIPRKALTRWEACSSHLVNAFNSLGCDAQVRDATRILRVLHTVNQKSGKIVRVVWLNPDQKTHKFNDLCNAVLPYTQDQIKEFRANAKQKKLNNVQQSAVIHFASAKGFSTRTLNWSRFNDLQTIHKLRNYDMGDSLREPLAFYMANQYALCHQQHHADPNQYHELLRVVKDTHKNIEHSQSVEKAKRLHGLMREAQSGVTKVHAGKEYSPLYTPTNDYFINLFGISSDEQKHLNTIIDSTEYKKRDAERDTKRRRAAGAVTRDEYEKLAQDKAKQAQTLKKQGLSQRAIARDMGVSVGSVNKYLKGVQSPSA